MRTRRDLPTKVCATCGRTFAWRRAWERTWDDVRYCSKRCRNERPNDVDRALEEAIIELLAERDRHATICPSEAARRVGDERWRNLMERARRAGRRLEAAGEVVITQNGKRVDPGVKGPIRIGRASAFSAPSGR